MAALPPTLIAASSAAQTAHRRALVSFWDIKPGSRVLELGCGQGDCTVVLAEAVGEKGHVDAVDPGAADYGSPLTLSQAQHLITTTSPLGPLITFHLSTDPLTYLASYTGPPYDYVVLAHCIYYFASPSTLPSLLTALKPHCKKLCIAEWSLRSSGLDSVPHVLTVLLMSQLIIRTGRETTGNVRTILSPAQISSAVGEAGFKLEKEDTKMTVKGMEDGHWEVGYLLRKREKVVGELRGIEGVGEREVRGVESMYDAVVASLEGVEGGVEGVSCMDFWVGVWGVE